MRRVAWVLIAYMLLTWLVVGFAGWLERVLALPPLFRTLGAGLLALGVPVAVVVAWRFPELGDSGRQERLPPNDGRGPEGR